MKNYLTSIFIVILLMIVSTLISCVQSSTTASNILPLNLAFKIKYPGQGGSDVSAATTDDQGNLYIVGYTGYDNATGFSDYTTIKYGGNGKQLWIAIYKSPAKGNNTAESIAIDNSGNVYVTGQSEGIETHLDCTTIKYDSNGTQIWCARYNGPGNGNDSSGASLAINDSGVYVTGSSAGVEGKIDFLTIKYDLNGNVIWEDQYRGPDVGDNLARALAVDKSGNVYVTGTANGVKGAAGGTTYVPQVINPNGKGYFLTIKYDSLGKQLWTVKYKGTENSYDDIPHAIKVDSNGNVYITGESSDNGNGTGYGCETVKYDGDGHQLWADRYEGNTPGNSGAFDMVIDSLGNIIVTGYSPGLVNEADVLEYTTVKYNQNGNRLWVSSYAGPRGDNIAYSIAVDKADNVYITGMSGFIKYDSTSLENYATVKYDTNGNQIWSTRYGDGGNTNNVAEALVLDTSDNVYVAGTSISNETNSNSAITIVKYIQNR
jgi:hypothetical protein